MKRKTLGKLTIFFFFTTIILSLILFFKLKNNSQDEEKEVTVNQKTVSIIPEDYFTLEMRKVLSIRNNEDLSNLEVIGKSSWQENVPLISQVGEYPNGCEIVSTVMLLQYYKFNLSVNDFIDKYLPYEELDYQDNTTIGPDPSQYFVGNPYNYNGRGTLSPTITTSLNNYFKAVNSAYKAKNITGENIYTIASYKTPVVIWTTVDFTEVQSLYTWYSKDKNQIYYYPRNSHTVVLVGEDDDYFYINDPLNADEVQKVDKGSLEESFDTNARQAVMVYK